MYVSVVHITYRATVTATLHVGPKQANSVNVVKISHILPQSAV